MQIKPVPQATPLTRALFLALLAVAPILFGCRGGSICAVRVVTAPGRAGKGSDGAGSVAQTR
jgi:hypothetical protein